MANGNVIYLPPGVAAPSPSPAQAAAVPSGIPFDRNFFQTILPQAVGAFCSQTDCQIPRVELLTVDGTTHYVSGIIGVHDTWVALQIAKEEHRHPIQVFIPYNTIFRVEVHPESERRRHIGFITEPDVDGHPHVIQEPAQIVAAADAPAEPAPAPAPAESPAESAEKPAATRKPSARRKPAT